MVKILILFSLLFLHGQLSSVQGQFPDGCIKDKSLKPPKVWMSEVSDENYKVKAIQGKVTNENDDPLSNVVIEIIRIAKNGKGKRIQVCRTQEIGRYSFTGLKAGKYEVRFTKELYNQITILVEVVKNEDFVSDEIVVRLRPGN